MHRLPCRQTATGEGEGRMSHSSWGTLKRSHAKAFCRHEKQTVSFSPRMANGVHRKRGADRGGSNGGAVSLERGTTVSPLVCVCLSPFCVFFRWLVFWLNTPSPRKCIASRERPVQPASQPSLRVCPLGWVHFLPLPHTPLVLPHCHCSPWRVIVHHAHHMQPECTRCVW